MIYGLIAAAIAIVGGSWFWLSRRNLHRAPREIKLAQTFHKLLEGEEAIGDLRELYNRSDHDVGIGLALGIVLRKRGDLKTAIRLHESLLTRQGLDPVVQAYLYAELAADFLASGLLERAVHAMEHTRKAVVVDEWICHKCVDVYTKLHRWDDAAQYLKAYAKASNGDTRDQIAWVYVHAAELALRDDQLAGAKEYFEQALKYDPNNVPAHLGISSFFRLTEKPEKALKYLDKHKSVFRDQLWQWVDERGRVAVQLGRAEWFLEQMQLDLQSDPDDWRSERVCAEVAMSVGQFDLAQKWLDDCLSRAPRVLVVHQSYWRLIRRSPDAAESLKKYMAEVREKMSFGRPYHCSVCDYHSDELLWRCPSCRRLKTLVEKRI
ncbi:MAG: hypothetical protein KDC35_20290 [Acidobacteria bacterium]|nr:hypothetical protein [Acidobacteriota bacterium]